MNQAPTNIIQSRFDESNPYNPFLCSTGGLDESSPYNNKKGVFDKSNTYKINGCGLMNQALTIIKKVGLMN